MFVNKEIDIYDFEDETFELVSYSSMHRNPEWSHIGLEHKYDISFGTARSKDKREERLAKIVADRYGIKWNIFIIGVDKTQRINLQYSRDKSCVRENRSPMNVNDYIKTSIFKYMSRHQKVFFDCLDMSWETSRQIGYKQLQQELQVLIGMKK